MRRRIAHGRSLPCLGEIVLRLKAILERFLNAVGCIDCCFVSDETLEQLPQPAKVGQTKVGGIDLNQTRMRRVAEAILALSTAPTGFTASELAGKVRAAYDIKKFRAKGMIRRIGKSRRYESVPEGLRAITALLVLREKVIRPLLAASCQRESSAKPFNPTPIDHHYESLRDGMRTLFDDLGIAA